MRKLKAGVEEQANNARHPQHQLPERNHETQNYTRMHHSNFLQLETKGLNENGKIKAFNANACHVATASKGRPLSVITDCSGFPPEDLLRLQLTTCCDLAYSSNTIISVISIS